MNLLYVLILTLMREIDGRVFCQDSNSLPWIPLGYACPVTCENVITAIDRLQMLDYNQVVSEQMEKDKRQLQQEKSIASLMKGNRFPHNLVQDAAPKELNKKVEVDDCFRVVEVNTTTTQSTKPYDRLKYDLFYDYIQSDYEVGAKPLGKKSPAPKPKNKFFAWRRSSNCGRMADECNNIQIDSKSSPVLHKLLRAKCKRRTTRFEDDFILKFTDVLNKYAFKQFQFTQDMTAMLLEKLLGESSDLSYGVFDIDKVLSFLRTAIKRHEVNPRSRSTVVVRARHCAGLRIGGCFCRTGFVERSEQCVSLTDCVTVQRQKYLSRVTIMQ